MIRCQGQLFIEITHSNGSFIFYMVVKHRQYHKDSAVGFSNYEAINMMVKMSWPKQVQF